MYLKKIEIIGFKSFAERIVLDLEHGITSIVGPNGCGKSNITDAVRWVLGEQSARQLRGSKMEDIIFNGTSKRPAQNLSEVTISLDNTQKILPIDFSEVVIMRRLYRTGESEYWINKTPCRLKDIAELLMDTGLGVNNYSVISQGKMEFLLHAKPEERRILFEEASGITKYKFRKQEALRKLDKVNTDLNRLSDILLEVKKQISKLDSQVRKVNKVKKLTEELMSLEMRHALAKSEKLKFEKERVSNNNTDNSDKINNINAEITRMEALISEKRLGIDEVEKEIMTKQEELYKIDSEISMSDEKISMATQLVQDYNYSIEQKLKIIEKLKIELIEIQEKFGIMDVEIGNNEELLKKCENELFEFENQFTSVELQYESTKNELSNLKTFFDELSNKKNNSNNDYLILKKDIESLNEKKTELENIIKEITIKTNNLTDTINHFEEKIKNLDGQLNTEDTKLNNLQEKRASLRSELEKINEEKNEITKDYNVKKSLHETLIHLKSHHEGYDEGTKEILQAGQSGVIGTIAEVINIDDKYVNLFENYFRSYLNYILVETEEQAMNAISFLESNEKGQCTFIVLDNIDRMINDGNVNIPTWLKVNDKKYEKLISCFFNEYEIKDNKLIFGATITGGKTKSGSKSEHGLLGRDDKIDKLQNEIDELVNKLNVVETDILNKKNSLSEIDNQIEFLEQTIHQNKMSLALQKKEHELKIEELNNTNKQYESIIENKEQIILRKEEKDLLKSELEQQLRSLEAECNDLSSKIEAKTGHFTSFENQRNNLNTQVNAVQLEFAELKGKENIKKLEKEQAISQSSNIQNQLTQLNNDIEELKTKIGNQNNQKIENEEKIKDVHIKRSEIESTYKALIDKKQFILQDFNQVEEELKTKKGVLDQLKNNQKDFEVALSHINSDQNNLIENLNSYYSIGIDEAKEKYGINDEDYSSEKVQALKTKIESYGELNLAAPEEYNQLEGRLSFMQTQEQDLVKAKNDLHKLIQKINGITKESFKETYEKVRENFKMIFSELFEGGQADLTLTNEENLLEAGVDVFVQPPGKKLQNISLLSGGEKALTAIAILFSFYLIKPSPFCILDEIDAPLDDVNLQRFISVLREFAKKSQFLIVTHNKYTMEMSDALYGVTMEEFGVSKIISVKFQKTSV
ncbi:chromosome segregation protein SMC [bacterium]